jgi:Cd2+/Zn2+-exporting ATPase
LRPVDGRSADEVLQRAASLEHHSEHPIARAIVAAAVDRNLALERVEQFSAERGIGVRGQVAGQWFAVCGSTSAANESSAPAGDLWRSHPLWREMTQSSSHTLAAVVGPDGLWGVIVLADQPRPEAAAVVAELRRLGIARVAMLTGDRRAVADDIARQVGIDEVHAELLPADKLAIVGQLKQQATVVAVVGDGVNDAPALAAAGLGIALGTEASDTALETADVVILRSDLRRLLDLMHIGLACRQRLIENIALALGAKLITLGLAAAGLATLWMAVAADVGATLAVVFNGMRLLGSTPRRRPMR